MSEKNIYNKEAKEKIKELADSIDISMFITRMGVTPLNMAPMSTKEVDEEGAIWFLSSKTHDTVMNINKDPRVQLCYSRPSKMEFLSVFGAAQIVEKKIRIEQLYGKTDDAWFDGVDDPNLCAIKVTPQEARYWEPKNGKVVTLLKMAYGAVTGNDVAFGNEGRLKP